MGTTLPNILADRYKVFIGTPIIAHSITQPLNVALNIARKGDPLPSASVNASPDTSLYQVIDGKCWYFSEITNRWTTLGSTSNTDWFAVDFGKPCKISGANIYPIADGKSFSLPDSLAIEYHHAGKWLPVNIRASNLLRSPAIQRIQ
jgi:hypothetical protein